jgi:hypothetical protein
LKRIASDRQADQAGANYDNSGRVTEKAHEKKVLLFGGRSEMGRKADGRRERGSES